MIKKNLWNFFLVLVIFFADRFSKIFVINSPKIIGDEIIIINSFLNLNLIWNEGIAFGLLSITESIYYNLITLLILLITAAILWMVFKSEGLEKKAFLMIFGGSLGNIYDRIYYSAVPDFIDIHVNNFHWFIFNVADIFITVGIVILICLEIFFKKKYE